LFSHRKLNKIDLKQKIDRSGILKRFKFLTEISAKKLKNINLLEDAIANLVYNGKVAACESILVSNLRHIELIKKAEKRTEEIIEQYNKKELERIPGKTEEESREIKILQTLNEVRTKIGEIVKKEFPRENPVNHMIMSGGGGNILNITQMASCVGQQALWGRRITPRSSGSSGKPSAPPRSTASATPGRWRRSERRPGFPRSS
jgi:DNA-directed RNA polymerase beta' subunit